MAYNVFDIATKILYRGANSEGGELISNLKLQKLLYYMQGFHLVIFDTPLFEEEIEAWQYGPVVPEVYHKYKIYGNTGLVPEGHLISLNQKEERLFDEVFSVYGEYSAIGLMNLTHNEKPWLNTRLNSIIKKKAIKSFFKSRID
jgi:uncharacterized phage-associated protein